VHEGDHVAAGQLLLELWNDDVRAELKRAEGEAVGASARVDEACTMADVAERDAQRSLRLRKQGVAAEEATDQAVGQATAKRAACQALHAAAMVSEARVEATKAALDRTMLHAPFAGVIAEVNGEVGEFVTPSPIGIPTRPAIDLIDVACLYVKAPIDEVDAAPIHPGMEARITLDAFPGRAFPGTVRRIAPYVLDLEKQARTVDVEADFADAAGQRGLLPGYSADIEVVLERHEDVLRVPTEAVLEGHRVLVFADSTLREQAIEPGLSNWQYTEVKSGLTAGEQVVVSTDRAGVKPGARARPDEGKSG
jgi:HlyD family secretion protein